MRMKVSLIIMESKALTVFMLLSFLILPSITHAENWIGEHFKGDAKKYEKYFKNFRGKNKSNKYDVILGVFYAKVIRKYDKQKTLDLRQMDLVRGEVRESDMIYGVVPETDISKYESFAEIKVGDTVKVYYIGFIAYPTIDSRASELLIRKISYLEPGQF